MTGESNPPDVVAHRLVTHVGEPVRLYFQEAEITVPVEPYRNGSVETAEFPVNHVDVVVERAEIADAGMNVVSFSGIHVPGPEWERIGLQKHWEADDVDLRSPLTDTSRRLEVWGSREDNFYESEPGSWGNNNEHLEAVPSDSPVITEWDPYDDDVPDQPPVPFEYPSLYVYALHSEDADPRAQNRDRVKIGTIGKVEELSEEELVAWPEEPDIEKRDLDIDLSRPPRYPEITFDELDPLPQKTGVLDAVMTVNRYAKHFDEKADSEYAAGNGAEARVASLRKKALYRVKTVAVHRFVKANPESVRVSLHELNGTHEMYCVYIGESYSFHQPIGAVEEQLVGVAGDTDVEESEVIDFTVSSDPRGDAPLSLEDALSRLADYDLNANEYLGATVVEDYDWGVEFNVEFSGIPPSQ